MFKFGQKVRCVKGHFHMGLQKGEEYTVAFYGTGLWLNPNDYNPNPDMSINHLTVATFKNPQVMIAGFVCFFDASRFEAID